jgi:threonine/homoserine/homoserine lactone efflux protein
LSSRALAHGRRTALASVAGNAAGVEVVAVCVALGIGTLVERSAGQISAQMLLLSLVSFAIALVSDSAWSVLASTVRAWFARSPRRLELVGGVALR